MPWWSGGWEERGKLKGVRGIGHHIKLKPLAIDRKHAIIVIISGVS